MVAAAFKYKEHDVHLSGAQVVAQIVRDINNKNNNNDHCWYVFLISSHSQSQLPIKITWTHENSTPFNNLSLKRKNHFFLSFNIFILPFSLFYAHIIISNINDIRLMEGSAYTWGFFVPALILLFCGYYLAIQSGDAIKVSAALQIDSKIRNKMVKKRGIQIGLLIKVSFPFLHGDRSIQIQYMYTHSLLKPHFFKEFHPWKYSGMSCSALSK